MKIIKSKKIISLQERHRQQCLVFMYKILNDQVAIHFDLGHEVDCIFKVRYSICYTSIGC